MLSVLYQLWCGNHEGYHPEPADMSERRYESATFDTDPMALSGRCTVTVLGSSVGSYELAVNCYGVPMRTGWFSVNEEHTVLKALEVKLIDGDGAYTGETAMLEPGQKVIFLRTDGDTLEDIMLPDGRIARIETDGYYSLSIGGEGVSRYFDNIYIWD